MERRAHNRSWRLLKSRLYNIMWRTDLYAVRFLLSGLAISWGLFAGNILGLLFIIQGSVMLWSLLCNKRPSITLWVDAVLGCALWTYTAFSPSIPINGMLSWVSIASWWLLVRYYSDEELQKCGQ